MPTALFHLPQSRDSHPPNTDPLSLLQLQWAGEPVRQPRSKAHTAGLPGLDRRLGSILERVHLFPFPLPERLVLASSDFQKMPDRPRCLGAAGKRPRWPPALPGEPGTFLTAAARGCQRAQTEFGFRSVPQWWCALAGGADVLTASAPLRSPWVSPRWRRLLCQECESFRFPLGIKANHK